MISVTLPLRIMSVGNLREHWAVKAKRAKAYRISAKLSVPAHPLPCLVTLTRIAPRKLDDDNLSFGFKSVRDGVADRLGIADNDPRVFFRYDQEKGKPKEYGVRITMEPM